MILSKEEATEFFSQLYQGEHHFPNDLKEYGPGWKMNHYGDLSTHDFDFLTRLVFLAHDKCIRVSIIQGGPRCVGITVHKRERSGGITLNHPTIEQALNKWRLPK